MLAMVIDTQQIGDFRNSDRSGLNARGGLPQLLVLAALVGIPVCDALVILNRLK